MAPSSRSRARKRTAKSSSSSSSSSSFSSAASRQPEEEKEAQEEEPVVGWRDVVSPTLLTQTLLVLSALVAVQLELVNSPLYLHSKELATFLKKSFVFLVCLSCHLQFAPLLQDPFRPKLSWRRLFWRHSVLLAASILANCAGTTVIQPVFGSFPMYHATTQQVLPIYFLVQLLLFVGVPSPLLQAVAGLFVSWFKAMSMTTLVLQWNSLSKHPVAFVLVCSANLCGSTWMIQFLSHCHRSNGIAWQISREWLMSMVQMLATSSIVGVIALIAESRARTPASEKEVFVLYFLIAWFSLDRYLKRSLTYFLTSSRKQL